MTFTARYLAGRKLRTVLTTLAIVFGVLVLFGALAAIIPARQAARLEIVQALRYE